jgi:glycosyltransferase involved in cell wall biosynthesis
MHVLIVFNAKIPVEAYGGTERVIWWLGKELVKRGLKVTYLVKNGSSCPFANVIVYQDKKPLEAQIPHDVDLVHIHGGSEFVESRPCLVTVYKSEPSAQVFHPNTVFLSADHALRHGSTNFVYHGIDLDDYGVPDMSAHRRYFHYLADATIQKKNIKGAIDIALEARERLHVIGGSRINLKSGLRITLSPLVRFHGMIGGDGKNTILQSSKGLIYPVLSHEPFSLAVIESLYFGCPVFGSPLGSLPELLGSTHHFNDSRIGEMDAFYSEFGVLSTKNSELSAALKSVDQFDSVRCHDYIASTFTSVHMTTNYLKLYEKALAPQPLVEAKITQTATVS